MPRRRRKQEVAFRVVDAMCRNVQGGELQPKVEAQRYGDVTMPMRFKDPEEAIGLRTHSESTGGGKRNI